MTKKQADYLATAGMTFVAVIVLTAMWICCPPIEALFFTLLDGGATIGLWTVIVAIHWGTPWADTPDPGE